MIVFQILLAAIFRWMGRLLNTVIGWETILIFGKVSEKRQIYLSLMGFSSIVWLVALMGILFPALATFLFTFIKITQWQYKIWIRFGMLIITLFLPMLIGLFSTYLYEPEQRLRDHQYKIEAIMKGYRFTLALSITMVMMMLYAPYLKIRLLFHQWEMEHVPMIVQDRDYANVVRELQKALESRGWNMEVQQANIMIRLFTRVFTFIASGDKSRLITDNLVTLRSSDFEVMLHPSDLVINGKKELVSNIRVAISDKLAFSKTYMTWDKEANELEEQLTELWHIIHHRQNGFQWQNAMDKLHDIEKEMERLYLPYDEWEVLFRKKLLVELSLLRLKANVNNTQDTENVS